MVCSSREAAEECLSIDKSIEPGLPGSWGRVMRSLVLIWASVVSSHRPFVTSCRSLGIFNL